MNMKQKKMTIDLFEAISFISVTYDDYKILNQLFDKYPNELEKLASKIENQALKTKLPSQTQEEEEKLWEDLYARIKNQFDRK